MEAKYNGLTCAVAGQVATLTPTADRTEQMPPQLSLAAGGIVINLTANIADMYEPTATKGYRYTVIIRRES